MTSLNFKNSVSMVSDTLKPRRSGGATALSYAFLQSMHQWWPFPMGSSLNQDCLQTGFESKGAGIDNVRDLTVRR
jgi:hypothetical protein